MFKDKKKFAEKTREEAQKYAQETIEQAKLCLETEVFKKYKTKLEKTRDILFEALIIYDEPDPVKYAFVIKDMIQNLRNITYLAKTIEKDSRTK